MSTNPDPQTKRGGLMAVLWAGVVLSAADTTFGLAMGWDHPLGYYALCAGFTLLLSGLIGGLTRMLGRDDLGLALWCGVSAGLVGVWPEGIAIGVLAYAVARLVPGPQASGLGSWVEGTCAGVALVLALHVAPLSAETGAFWELFLEGFGKAAFFAVVLFGTRWGAGSLPTRLRGAPAALVGLVALILFAASPYLERPNGLRRLPSKEYLSSTPRQEGERPNVFLLILDTVRADHLSVYGYERDTTPYLTRFVEERNGAVYPQAYSNGTWTVPSHGSLFTGRLPNEHGVHFDTAGDVRWKFKINPEVPTLAEKLQEDGGYATLGAFANNWLRIVGGMGRGFDRYMRCHQRDPLAFVGERLRHLTIPGVYFEVEKSGARADLVNATLMSLIDPWSKGPNPLYVMANYGDAHGPYAPLPDFRGRFAAKDLFERPKHLSIHMPEEEIQLLKARYDEELAYLDYELHRFFEGLRERDLLDNSWIFITSDHGEAFGEHGVTEHGTAVYNEVIRVPLIALPPKGIEIEPTVEAVSLIDVAQTIAAIGGVEIGGPGRDLRSVDSPITTKIEFYGDRFKAGLHGALAAERARAIIRWPYKLVARAAGFELYDIEQDPQERDNLADELPDVVQELEAQIEEWGTPTAGAESPEGAALENLRGLGYVDSN